MKELTRIQLDQKSEKKAVQKSTTSTAMDEESEGQNDSDQDSTSSESDSDSIDKGKLFQMLFDSYKKSKSQAKRRKKDKKEAKKSAIVDSYLDPEETLICADNMILVTSMSSTGSSLKDGYNVLPDADETINVTDSSDTPMEESKLLREGEDVSDDIFNDPIFKDPSQRLIIPKNNLNLSYLIN